MKIENIQTPALVVFKDVFEENIRKMNALIKNKIDLRPHYKSHKCARIAHIQIENGAVGMTCAKLSEAFDLADSGVENILIANQIVDKEKIAKLAFLAKKCRLTVCVDNWKNIKDLEEAAAFAGSKIYCLVEFEIGMCRCGVESKEAVLGLAREIIFSKHLEFQGIQAYAGHASHEADEEKRRFITSENEKKLRNLIGYLEGNGVFVKTVSGGSTGTCTLKADGGVYTELQAGSYIFMDSTYSDLDIPFKNSLFLVATVVSVKGNIAVIDAGVKSCGVDQGMPKCVGFTTEKIVASEEHFQLHSPSEKLEVGQKVLLIPAHCCSTVNLHEKIYMCNGETVTDRFDVTARGCFR